MFELRWSGSTEAKVLNESSVQTLGLPDGEKMRAERKVGSWVPESPKDESMTGSADDNTE